MSAAIKLSLCYFAFIFVISLDQNWAEDANLKHSSNKTHKNGYIIYCPCMGRFGNQADHFLGALAFAKNLGRTLVLPPWPTMKGHIPFDQWFKIEAIETYHAVITAEKFMAEVAPQLWPPGKRIGFCYKPSSYRHMQCDLKLGSPFKPFWDHLDVDFDSTESYNVTYANTDRKLWNSFYPVKQYPVLAMKGAPAPFPVLSENVELHKFLWWSDQMVAEASHFIYDLLRDEKFIAIHLRNGVDWEKACQHAVSMTHMMSSPQCTGYNSKDLIPMEMCLPDKKTIVRDLRQAVEDTGITHVYVLTDRYPLISEIESALSDLSVRVTHGDPDIPQIDLIVASRAELFIGNCVSSFSAFIKRERDHVTNKPSRFFGFS